MARPRLQSANYRLQRRDRADDTSPWCACWTDPATGKPKRVSSGTADETLAKQWFADFIHVMEAPPEENEITLGHVYDWYLDAKATQYKSMSHAEHEKKRKIEALHYAIKPLRELWGAWHPSVVTREHGRQYVKSQVNAGKSSSTIHKQIGIHNAAINMALKEQILKQAATLQLPPLAPSRERLLTPSDFRRLREAAIEPHIELFILLAVYTCSRREAILSLTWDQVDFKRRQIDFNPQHRTHTRKRRVATPINSDLFQALYRARSVARSEFVVSYNDNRILDIKTGLAATCKRAGINRISAHDLRRTGATWMAMAGEKLEDIATYLGDSIEITHKHYAKYQPEWLRTGSDALERVAQGRVSLPSGKDSIVSREDNSLFFMVEPWGVEPQTSTMPFQRPKQQQRKKP